MSKAVVLLSGGLDSCVTLAVALEECEEVRSLCFCYGQTHENKESLAAAKISQYYQVPHIQMPLRLNELVGSASSLTKGGDPRTGRTLEEIHMATEVPSTYVPSRNAVFLALASAYACRIKAERIYIGCNVVDYSGYPDCRGGFLLSMQEALNIGMKGVHRTTLRAPLLNMTKEEIVSKGRVLGAPIDISWSCYSPNADGTPCLQCDACTLRHSVLKAT